MTYRKALNILSFLEFEDDYAPWYSAITGFNWVLRRLAHDDTNLQRLKVDICFLANIFFCLENFYKLVIQGGVFFEA